MISFSERNFMQRTHARTHNNIRYYCLHTLVPHQSDWRIPATTDLLIDAITNNTTGDNSLVPLLEGEEEGFLHALFLGAPWYTFTLWWPAIFIGVWLVAEGTLHPAAMAAGMALTAGYYTTTRYSPVL